VVSRIFLPGQEVSQAGESRSAVILGRVLGLTDGEVEEELAEVRGTYAHRHRDLEDTWARHFALMEHRLAGAGRLQVDRRRLIGAYFTQEFAIEAAALFNPSMVPHPDQGGLPPGSTRFLMTVRAVGEGHISSVELRTGAIDVDGVLVIDPPALVAVLPTAVPTRYSRASFRQQLADLGGARTNSDFVLDALPEAFTREDLNVALDELRDQSLTRGAAVRTIDRFEWIAACTYSVEFPESSAVQERVLMPSAPSEYNGIEDVRMLRFTEDDGTARYLGTYTAYDGRTIASQLMETDDFRTFDMTQLNGPGSKNKGMALFPRRIGGRFVALSRADRESNGVTTSADLRHWDQPVLVQTPDRPWEIVQLGNCGPPVETEAGWLVLTHGVGPMRQYGIGALLLDLDDPTVVLGRLAAPLLTPSADERDGYVPNVVYSCGAMLHDRTLVLPYGCSDSATRIALVDLDPLLDALTRDPAIKETP
jgi:predicted GH43/DUF377 family glycosyl hydrolase